MNDMLAVSETKNINGRYITDSLEHKQISTIIKCIRDQHLKRKPGTKMPSNSLIEQLVINGAKKHLTDKEGWLLKAKLTLKEIILDTSYSDCQYINRINSMPLFPNYEGYTTQDIHQSMKLLLDELERLNKVI